MDESNSEIALILAVPSLIPVTIPDDTVATDEFDEVHITLLDAFEGEILTLNVTELPTLIVGFDGVKLIEVGGSLLTIESLQTFLVFSL